MRDFEKKWNQELGTYWLAPDEGVIQSRIEKSGRASNWQK